jgi:hypothetical protein
VPTQVWHRAAELRATTKRAPGAGARPRVPTSSRADCSAACTATPNRRCGRGRTALLGRRSIAAPGRTSTGRIRAPPPIPRAPVDEAVFSYFEQVALDWEATRPSIETALEERLTEVRELRRQAERDAGKAEGDLARMRRRFVEGEIDADEWREFRDELAAARDAATAKLDQLSEHERQLVEGGPVKDAEAETYRRVAEIRAAVAGEVRDAAGLEEVRAALRRLFDRFLILCPDAVDRAFVEDDVTLTHEGAEYVIWPVPREDAVEWVFEDVPESLIRASEEHFGDARPGLRREPLGGDVNKERVGFLKRYSWEPWHRDSRSSLLLCMEGGSAAPSCHDDPLADGERPIVALGDEKTAVRGKLGRVCDHPLGAPPDAHRARLAPAPGAAGRAAVGIVGRCQRRRRAVPFRPAVR